jgi:hypothetical protein
MKRVLIPPAIGRLRCPELITELRQVLPKIERAELVESQDGVPAGELPAIRAPLGFVTNEERLTERLPQVQIRQVDGKRLLDDLFEIVEEYRENRSGFVQERAHDVLKLARRYGPLRLCPLHHLPFGHGHSYPDPDNVRCLFQSLEPVGLWWDVGRRASATLHLIAAVRRGRSSEPMYDRDWEIVSRPIKQIRRMRKERKWNPRLELQIVVNWWLSGAEVGPRILWRRRAMRAEFLPFTHSGSPVYAAIASELALIACGVDRLAFCDLCGCPWRPTRRLRSDRRNPCPRCRKQAAADRQAAFRERRAASRKMRSNG